VDEHKEMQFQRSPEAELPFTLTVAKVRPLWAQRFWRHPIIWWKTRHIRQFIRRESKKPPFPGEQEIQTRLEREFLFGFAKDD
jgi:hypothetical protein